MIAPFDVKEIIHSATRFTKIAAGEFEKQFQIFLNLPTIDTIDESIVKFQEILQIIHAGKAGQTWI